MNKKVFCEYCGLSFSTSEELKAGFCFKHPDGANSGHHKEYKGGDRDLYACKYCGFTLPTIAGLVSLPCEKHPNGKNLGRHAPKV